MFPMQNKKNNILIIATYFFLITFCSNKFEKHNFINVGVNLYTLRSVFVPEIQTYRSQFNIQAIQSAKPIFVRVVL